MYRTAPLWALLAVYWTAAIDSHLNIGHRHILPVYPPMFVLAGSACCWGAWRFRGPVMTVVCGLLIALVVESVIIWPNYLAYFNQLAGGPKNGYKHLAESSLDWGQDLIQLKAWLARQQDGRAANDSAPAGGQQYYLSYFGSASPTYYGIDVTRLRGFGDFDAPVHMFPALKGGVYCVSATILQINSGSIVPPWDAEKEAVYQSLRLLVGQYFDAQKNPELMRELLQQRDARSWASTVKLFDQLRLARLWAYLRKRQPDDNVGYSILIYRLSDGEVEEALE